jgi:hypothetical protein
VQLSRVSDGDNMTGQDDKARWVYGSKEYANERSQSDAQISNENVRAAAQAALLINGGAATAVLAFLSKEKIDPFLLKTVPICLLGYAIGVFSGAFMTFCMGQALRSWSVAWREYSINPDADTGRLNSYASRWHRRGRYAFYAAMGCFIVASAVLAVLLCRSQK